jgi:acyl-coenzyme A thioesterase PaaI-like protein
MFTAAKRVALPVSAAAVSLYYQQQQPVAFLEAAAPRPALDASYLRIPVADAIKTNHAIYENVNHEHGVSKYHVFRSPKLENQPAAQQQTPGAELCVADLKFGGKVNGHRGIVHGGVASLLYDDVFGFGYFMASGGMLGYTANLSVNYKSPLPEGTEAILRVFLDRIEGRKVFLWARLESADGGTVYSEATALYIVDRRLKKMKLGE